MTELPPQDQLRRALSLPLLVAFGVGTMVGGGFYALLGRVAYHAGSQLPCAILVAAVVASITSLSFGELASRFPFSAGESRYVDEAFGMRALSIFVGWAVISTGVISAATLTRAFVGFVQDLVMIPTYVGISVFVVLLTALSVRGILESVWFAAAITVIEVGGLLWVLLLHAGRLLELPARWHEIAPDASWDTWAGITMGGFLAFYAFIGFEDMVNEAEEVQSPRRNLPRGILLALLITSMLYLLIATTAVLAIPVESLIESRTPLATLVHSQGSEARMMMIAISLLAGINGALVQIIMSSRVAYGMSSHGQGPRILAAVHSRLQTPVPATILMGTLVLVFALWLPVETLARITSAIMLMNFALVNAALVRLKLKRTPVPSEVTVYPLFVPVIGTVCCLTFLGLQIVSVVREMVS